MKMMINKICVLLVFFFGITAAAESSKDRLFNFRVQPIGLALGEYTGDFNISPISFLEFGVIGYMMDVRSGNVSAKGNGLGGRFSFHFSTVRNDTCMFLSAYYYKISNVRAVIEPNASNFSASESGALLGKMWVWDSGFNMSLATGVRSFTPKTITIGTYTHTMASSSLRIEFTVGWAI